MTFSKLLLRKNGGRSWGFSFIFFLSFFNFELTIEEVVTTDEHLKELKVKILHLKDEIYSILRR